MNTLVQLLVIATLFCTLTVFTQQQCIPKTKIPHLHKNTIRLDKMHPGKLKNNLQYHNYIYNYPIELLKVQNKQFLLYIHQMQWNDNRNLNNMDYSLKKYVSQTALLISLTSRHIEWSKLDMGILLLTSPQIQNQMYTNQIYFEIKNQKNIAQIFSLPQNSLFQHVVTFITGINIQCTSLEKTQFQLDVKQKLSSPNQIQFTVLVGNKNKLNSLLLSFIAYKQSQQNLKRSGQFIIVNLIGNINNGLRSDLPSTQYYFFGFSGFKFLPQQGLFGINFDIVSQYVLKTSVKQPINYLKVRFFGISSSPEDICSHCSQTPFVFSSQWQTQCIFKCDSDSFQKQYDIGGQGCVRCPPELNMTLSQNGCICSPGFIVLEGKCVSFMDIGNTGQTFSLDDSDCVGNNMQKNTFGQCDCKLGYQNRFQQCVKKCGTGFWNGFSCTFCEPGKYGREQFQQCFTCSQNCELCQSENICKYCNIGFQLSSQRKCIQVCGDGGKINDECDDGNRINGDGCSDECKIQKNYQCMGGSQTYPDFCTPFDFDIKNIIQTVVSSNLILDCEISPPKYFDQQELQQIVTIHIKQQYNRPQQVFIRQKQINKIKLIFVFGNQFPVIDFNFDITFRFSEQNKIKRTQTTQLYNRRIGYFAMYQQRQLI